MSTLVIPRRFNGPPSSGNGGFSAGLLAEALLGGTSGAVQVTLRQPPPLETPMVLSDDNSACSVDGAPVLHAERAGDLAVVDPVTYDEAQVAMASFPGFARHPFPTCFTCGHEREDGLGIFPGPAGSDLVASTWTPAEDVTLPLAWAAMDCIGGWSTHIGDNPSVLGRMTCVVDAVPQVGEPHVLVGRLVGVDGRKTSTQATLYDADGRVVARASHVWIAIDLANFA